MRSGIAQSFLESVTAAAGTPADAHHDAGSPTDNATCECCCRCGRSPKWQPVGPGRKRRSKSYTAIRTGISELSGWDLEIPKVQEPAEIEVAQSFGQGQAPLERLPAEVLGERVADDIFYTRFTDKYEDEIVSYLAIDAPTATYAPRNEDLISCLLTSKTIHVAAINTLYSQVTILHSATFAKFSDHVSSQPWLGNLVRRLDLSQLTSVGLGRSRQANSEVQNLTSQTLLKCLELTPIVQEVLLQENLDDDLDRNVLHKLFFGLSNLRAVDFCASSSASFVDAFTSTLTTLIQTPSLMLNIRRLGLHECATLPSSAFETLLPRLPNLTHLDALHTRITDRALQSIPASASLSHLNLGRCTQLTGGGVVDFLTSHQAAKELVYLNLSSEVSHYRLLYEADLDRLLPFLPSTLCSLNLNGAQIQPHHVAQLLPLTKHLEELGLACANLSLADINSFFRPRPTTKDDDDESESSSFTSAGNGENWQVPSLYYMDLSYIASITQSSLFTTPAPDNILLSPATLPLDVIELGDKAISSLRECKNTNKRLGWVVRELGRRGWYVRENGGSSSGRRAWKMGAMWRGMRKVPVAWGEVAGLYGHYMFKK